MKFIVIAAMLFVMTGCIRPCKPPKFYNGQTVQLVDGKARVTIVGTSCDGNGPCSCRYVVKLNADLYVSGLVGEFEIEEAK